MPSCTITTAAERAANAALALCEQFADDMPCVPLVQMAIEWAMEFHEQWQDADELPLEREDIVIHLTDAIEGLEPCDLEL
jgi:hypothetical protein